MTAYYLYDEGEEGLIHAIEVTNIIKENHNSPYQRIDVLDTKKFGRILILDNVIQFSEVYEHIYHESIVHPALLMHPCPKKILVLGGGDGGAIREIMKYQSVESVTMVELDQEVISISKEYLPKLSANAFDDKRLTLHINDAEKFIAETTETFDVIISDITDCTGETTKLYTKEFFESVSSKLDKDGIFVCHTWPPDDSDNFPIINNTLSTVFPRIRQASMFIPEYFWDFVFIFCFKKDQPLLSIEEIDQRLRTRNVRELKFIDGSAYQRIFTLPKGMRDAMQKKTRLSTNDHPFALHRSMKYIPQKIVTLDMIHNKHPSEETT